MLGSTTGLYNVNILFCSRWVNAMEEATVL